MNRGNSESAGRDLNELQHRLEAVENAERAWRSELRARGCDVERVTFLFNCLLHGAASVVGVENECGLRWVGETRTHRDARLTREIREETLGRAFEERIVLAFNRHEE